MVEEFKEFLLGSWDNRRQAFSFPSQYSQISLRHELLQNGMIYGEQRYTVRKQPPYRQFVLEVKQVEDKIIVSSYKVRDGNKYLYFTDIDKITKDDLEKNEGCDCIFIKQEDTYIGRIIGCDCIVERNGKESFLVTISILKKDKYKVIDRGYSPETKEMLWGSEHGMFEFDKELN
jgi:CpeT protein